jgi:hypothetical protein
MRARHLLWSILFSLLAMQGGGRTQSLGQVEDDYEPHSDLMLASGELAGFAEGCGFGRRPDRDEMLGWYRRHTLARSSERIAAIFDLGVTLGLEGPCTVDENIRLVRRWESLMQRTEAYVRDYRSGAPPEGFGSSSRR